MAWPQRIAKHSIPDNGPRRPVCSLSNQYQVMIDLFAGINNNVIFAQSCVRVDSRYRGGRVDHLWNTPVPPALGAILFSHLRCLNTPFR